MATTPDFPAREAAAAPAALFSEFVYSTLDEKRAEDIVWLDVRDVTYFADEFIIATVLNSRQGRAILDACDKEAKRRGLERIGVEGEAGSSWILIDYGDLIIHLFSPKQREYYALEHIWADAKRMK